MPDDTSRRKDAHLDLCAEQEVEPPGNDPLFGEVHLVHNALPELDASSVDSSLEFLGKKLAHPIVLSGMTGGTERARAINRGLAQVAEELGLAFGLGSQRAMLEDPALTPTFQVRDLAPGVALIGNIGLWQARALGADGVRRLMDAVGADGMAVHLNAAQELAQPEGDRDFRGGLAAIESLARALGERLIVKETGCGIAPGTARRLVDAGVRTIDVAGLGGTSWIRVEALRSAGLARGVGLAFSDWGIPTAAAVRAAVEAVGGRAHIIASGGIRGGSAALKALALGARLVGFALPVFRAWETAGPDGVRAFLHEVIAGIRFGMALTGSANLAQLATRPLVLTGALASWVSGLKTGVSTEASENQSLR